MEIQAVDLEEVEYDPWGSIAKIAVKNSVLDELCGGNIKYFVEAYGQKFKSYEVFESGILKYVSDHALLQTLQSRKVREVNLQTGTFNVDNLSVKIQSLADTQKLELLFQIFEKYSYSELWDKLKNFL